MPDRQHSGVMTRNERVAQHAVLVNPSSARKSFSRQLLYSCTRNRDLREHWGMVNPSVRTPHAKAASGARAGITTYQSALPARSPMPWMVLRLRAPPLYR